MFAKSVRQQLIDVCNRLHMKIESCGSDFDMVRISLQLSTCATPFTLTISFQVRKCLIIGLFDNIAELQSDQHYLTLTGRQRVKIHPTSVFCDKEKPKYIVFSELIATGRTYVRTVSAVEQEWVEEAKLKLKQFNVNTSSFSNRRHGMHELNAAAIEQAGTSNGGTSSSNNVFHRNSKTPDHYQFSTSNNWND